MSNITEERVNFKIFERDLFNLMCLTACGLIQEQLAISDKLIADTRDKQRYRLIDCKRETTIKTLFGEVTYVRRYYFDNEIGRYVFLLDEDLSIFNGFGLVSENLVEKIIHDVTEISFRKVATGISAFTGQHISAQGAWNVVQKYSNAIEKQEIRLAELEDSGSVGHLGNISTKVLFVEHDDVWIARQREKRRAPGTVAKGAKMIGKKLGKRPMHVGFAYTGWKESKDGRHNTVNKMAYASFGRSSTFRVKFGTLLNHRYDMDGVERRITNGDGESWIRTEAEATDSILQLDPFHRSQSIMRIVKEVDDRKLLFAAIKEKDIDKIFEVLYDLIMKAQDEKEQEKLIGLHNYLYDNKDSLLTWKERGIKLPDPPKGIVYREMGVAESNNNIYTMRMKHRRGAWSENGANNMARILSYRSTIGFGTILGILPEPEPETEVYCEPLSAKQASKPDGKGYGADWLHAPLPYENAFKTSGREAIRGLLRQKPLSGIIH